MNVLSCWVYRPNYDCTNGGVSSKAETILVARNKQAAEKHREEHGETRFPLCFIVTRQIFNREYKHIEPLVTERKHFMAGGNFAYSSDSRWKHITDGVQYPLSIHDRYEG